MHYYNIYSDTEINSSLTKGYHECTITIYIYSDTEINSSLTMGYHECTITIYIYKVILK